MLYVTISRTLEVPQIANLEGDVYVAYFSGDMPGEDWTVTGEPRRILREIHEALRQRGEQVTVVFDGGGKPARVYRLNARQECSYCGCYVSENEITVLSRYIRACRLCLSELNNWEAYQ
ncbi:hypothetical protein D6833_08250 [Candidatus Parcubacteria bacterium]|nr:MAG: hypothetical protein D6833_08250 [Candidatus Parcubacteria bacterium]